MPSITFPSPSLKVLGPLVEVAVMPSQLYIESNKITKPTAIKITAMVDTGASSSVIKAGIASMLGINPVGVAHINTPSSTGLDCNQFDMQLVFPNNLAIPSIILTEAPLQGQHIQCLIGRDVLENAVLIYIGYNNSFTLSFCLIFLV